MAGDRLRLDQIYRPAVIILDPETGRPLAPEAVLSKLGEMGLVGGVIDPSLPEPSDLTDYSLDEEGTIGIATFEELKGFVRSRGATQALATNIWQPFARKSSQLATNAALFHATSELRTQRDEIIRAGESTSTAATSIDGDIVAAYREIRGRNHYLGQEVSDAAGSIIEFHIKDPTELPDPFVFEEPADGVEERVPLVLSGRGTGRYFEHSIMELDAALGVYLQGDIMRHANAGNKALPHLVRFFNQRIDMARTASSR